MPKRKRIRAIIDTNLFISFLIGKRLEGLKKATVEFKCYFNFFRTKYP